MHSGSRSDRALCWQVLIVVLLRVYAFLGGSVCDGLREGSLVVFEVDLHEVQLIIGFLRKEKVRVKEASILDFFGDVDSTTVCYHAAENSLVEYKIIHVNGIRTLHRGIPLSGV